MTNIYYIKPENFEIGMTVSEEGLACYDLERTICDHFKNHTRISWRRLRELSKKYREYDGKNIELLKSYAERLNLSVAAMQKMDWMIFKHFEEKKKQKKRKKRRTRS